MNKFDELLALNEKLDAVLSDMNKANNHLESELKAKRDAAQKQMFDDIQVLRDYMKRVGMREVVLNTKVSPTGRPDIVMGITVCTSTTDIGMRTMSVKDYSNYSFHRWFEKDTPVAKVDVGSYGEYKREYMFTLMKHWGVAYSNMKNDFFDKMKDFMAEKANKVAKRQSELVNQLDDFDKKE